MTIRATSKPAADAERIAELEAECMASMRTIAEERRRADRAEASLAAQPARVPEGWRLVPVEPTEEMRQAMYAADTAGTPLLYVWLSMLAAAPTPAELERLDRAKGGE